jgi:hypothetical protein
MKEKPIGCVSFSSSVSLKPWHRDPEEYVVEITGKILVHSDDGEEEAGQLSLILVQATEACNDQVSLYQVCDCHSDLLQQIHSIVMQSDSEVRDELNVEGSWSDLLVIESRMPRSLRSSKAPTYSPRRSKPQSRPSAPAG